MSTMARLVTLIAATLLVSLAEAVVFVAAALTHPDLLGRACGLLGALYSAFLLGEGHGGRKERDKQVPDPVRSLRNKLDMASSTWTPMRPWHITKLCVVNVLVVVSLTAWLSWNVSVIVGLTLLVLGIIAGFVSTSMGRNMAWELIKKGEGR